MGNMSYTKESTTVPWVPLLLKPFDTTCKVDKAYSTQLGNLKAFVIKVVSKDDGDVFHVAAFKLDLINGRVKPMPGGLLSCAMYGSTRAEAIKSLYNAAGVTI